MTRDRSPCKHEGDRVLLVEGIHDCHVVLALRNAHAIPETFGIYECGGEDGVLRRANALIPSSVAPRTLGLVLDADKPDCAGRWASVRDKLSRHDYSFPPQPVPGGAIFEGSERLPRLGVWLMPNNQDAGMLEDFCFEMADPGGRAYAEQVVVEARNRGVTTFQPAHFRKAVVYTYLAWRDRPGLPLGQAVTRQSLAPETPVAREFTTWLRQLFVEDGA
jgi:hypothetical protein